MPTRYLLRLLLLLGGIVPLLATSARSQDDAGRKELEAIHQQYLQAYLAKDAGPLRAWFERYLAANVLEISLLNERRNRQQVLEETRQAQTFWLPAKESTGTIEAFVRRGSEVVVLCRDRLVRPMANPRDPPTVPPHELMMLTTERDTWVKGPGGWKCTLSVNLTAQTTLDGKPLPMPGSLPAGPAPEETKPGGGKGAR